jgi:hypothetical protein
VVAADVDDGQIAVSAGVQPIGCQQASVLSHRLPIRNRRHSRLETCATSLATFRAWNIQAKGDV